jgi:hypothetical protein
MIITASIGIAYPRDEDGIDEPAAQRGRCHVLRQGSGPGRFAVFAPSM